MKPAWSEQFEPDRLPRVAALLPEGRITAEWAWGGSDGSGVKVAVVDSGIEAGHEAVGEVRGFIALEADAAAPGGIRESEGEHEDLAGHGTACAGIIRSLAPGAELYSVRVLSTSLKGRGDVLVAGIRWAIEHGMDVVNLSLSSKRQDLAADFHAVVDEAYFARVMLVSAINNVPAPSLPSEYAGVFSVASHHRDDPFGLDYNPSGPVEFGARGIDIEIPWRGGRTIRSTGNSFAAAHVTGLIARVLGKHPGLTPFQMKTVLQAAAGNAA